MDNTDPREMPYHLICFKRSMSWYAALIWYAGEIWSVLYMLYAADMQVKYDNIIFHWFTMIWQLSALGLNIAWMYIVHAAKWFEFKWDWKANLTLSDCSSYVCISIGISHRCKLNWTFLIFAITSSSDS